MFNTFDLYCCFEHNGQANAWLALEINNKINGTIELMDWRFGRAFFATFMTFWLYRKNIISTIFVHIALLANDFVFVAETKTTTIHKNVLMFFLPNHPITTVCVVCDREREKKWPLINLKRVYTLRSVKHNLVPFYDPITIISVGAKEELLTPDPRLEQRKLHYST